MKIRLKFSYKGDARESTVDGESLLPEGSVVAAPANQGCKTNPGSPDDEWILVLALIKKKRLGTIPKPLPLSEEKGFPMSGRRRPSQGIS